MLLMLSLIVACQSTVGPVGTDQNPIVPPPPSIPPTRVSALFDAPPPVAMPSQALVRHACFTRNEEEGWIGRAGGPDSGGLGLSGSGVGGGGAANQGFAGIGTKGVGNAPSMPKAAARPKPSPMADMSSVSPADAAPRTTTTDAKSQPDPTPAAEVAAAPPAPPEKKPSAEPMLGKSGSDDDLGDRKSDKKSDGFEESKDEARRMAANTGPKLDWGAKVYLSNDDSMSLASAQHLLHAVKNGESFSVNEIRPHELLNYFSFDTKPLEPGHLFSVHGAAEKIDSDSVTMAFAVHGATPPRRPLDLTLVIDRSGSMWDEGRMEYVKRGLKQMTEHLVTGDRVDVVLFDDEACSPIENFTVGRDDMGILNGVIDEMRPRGGTNIGVGLNEGYRIATAADRSTGNLRNRRVMLMTDALANQGEIEPSALAAVGGGFEQQGIRLTGVGVGVGFNDKILDSVTEKGHGAYVYLGSEAVVDRLFGSGFDSLVQTIANDVQFSIQLPPSLAMERFYGEEASTDAADIQPINYYAGTTQLFLQDLTVDPSKLAPSDTVVFTMSYKDAITGEPGTETFVSTVGDLLAGDRHNLDKGRALMSWTDMLTARAMGNDPCGATLSTYAERAGKLADDAEITYVNGLVGGWCRLDLPTRPIASVTAGYKVKVDSDIPIAEVELACDGRSWKESLSGSDTVARFDAATSGACTVTLQGNLPMTAAVTVPKDGGDVKCTVRGGRLSCG